jgi:hypothetical protein
LHYKSKGAALLKVEGANNASIVIKKKQDLFTRLYQNFNHQEDTSKVYIKSLSTPSQPAEEYQCLGVIFTDPTLNTALLIPGFRV